MKPQPHWSQQQNSHWPQRSRFKASQQLVKGNPTRQFLHYPHLLHIHSTPTHVSKFCFVPLFFLPLATLTDVGSIFWHLLWETSTLEHATIILHFASGVRIQTREELLQQDTFGTWQVSIIKSELQAMSYILSVSVPFCLLPLIKSEMTTTQKSLPAFITKLPNFE